MDVEDRLQQDRLERIRKNRAYFDSLPWHDLPEIPEDVSDFGSIEEAADSLGRTSDATSIDEASVIVLEYLEGHGALWGVFKASGVRDVKSRLRILKSLGFVRDRRPSSLLYLGDKYEVTRTGLNFLGSIGRAPSWREV